MTSPAASGMSACELPPGALLAAYRRNGAYTDCYVAQVSGTVTQAEYVEAFYTTAVFKLERLLLAWLVRLPSSDGQARELAIGRRDAFAAWTVEGRGDNQLLMCDFQQRTRSWLMTAPLEGGTPGTRLYFGSAVVPLVSAKSGEASMGFAFRALLGFHKLYSRVLLRSTIARLAR